MFNLHFLLKSAVSEEEKTLVLSHVLFRHGNRTPEPHELYPKDPYINETYYPYGYGQLTKAGKQKEFNIGRALRDRYKHFLGDYFLPQIVEALSTDYYRTKMSLELVLASLFLPNKEQMFETGLYWQPVPYDYLPSNHDPVLRGFMCPTYRKLYNNVSNSKELEGELRNHEVILDFVSKNTGLSVTRYADIYDLYFGLLIEEDWGLALPSWTKEVWPEPMNTLAVQEYYVMTKTREMRQMAVGYFLEKVIRDTTKVLNGTAAGKKLYLYSAHEDNIAKLLIVLGIFQSPHIPPYGSYIMLEVHLIDKVHGFKIFYENYSGGGPKLLKLPACEEFCPLDQFTKIVSDLIPDRELCGM
ncbi:unnamed protein product [Acanthoscelides obtectus]|uniref:acid phosphatase n=1 Tax=Acanthoscelides obtectus TaxID=200917 RepID=A0A9P0L030_ACAOB|nr:unnamed protein product [Acanthoscelides obtectus]CAK1661701.1 hypothetical protein AOBTE_LOCUS22743 [Acanthoscelides obtectus]